MDLGQKYVLKQQQQQQQQNNKKYQTKPCMCILWIILSKLVSPQTGSEYSVYDVRIAIYANDKRIKCGMLVGRYNSICFYA